MLRLIVVGFLIWGFFSPRVASWSYIGVLALFEGWIAGVHHFGSPNFDWRDLRNWTPIEVRAIERYHLYFRWPFASRLFSSTLSATQMAVFIWVPLLLWHSQWIQAGVVGVNYLIAGGLAALLNPRFFLHDAFERRGDVSVVPKMQAVDSVCNKIVEAHASEDWRELK